MKYKFTNWKTTLAGVILAVGTYLTGAADLSQEWKHVGNIMAIVGSAGIGLYARDFDKSTEESVGESKTE